VLGLEADISYVDLDDEAELPDFGPPEMIRGTSSAVDYWLATVRGRVGFAAGEGFLVCATGGLAVAQVDLDAYTTLRPKCPRSPTAVKATRWFLAMPSAAVFNGCARKAGP